MSEVSYFAGFGIVPNYYAETGELAFAHMVYQVRNLYQPVADIELILKVSLDGETLEDILLLSMKELSLGDISGSQDYIPPQGWGSGSYTFKAELYVNGEPYAVTLAEQLNVESTPSGISSFSVVVYGLVGVGAALVFIVLFWQLRRTRRGKA
jgi:hypothetical protein